MDATGKALFDRFFKNRSKEKTVNFHKPLEKAKTKTSNFTEKGNKKKKLKEDKNQLTIKAQRNLFGQLLVLSQEHSEDLQKVLQNPWTPMPWRLASSDGSPLKTNMETLLHKLTPLASLNSEHYSKNQYTTPIMWMEMPYCKLCQEFQINLGSSFTSKQDINDQISPERMGK